MSIRASYFTVMLIWSTTPLAIKWSSEGPSILFAVTSRMAIGTVLCLLLLILLRTELPWHRAARKAYLAAGLGIYGTMICVYWSAQYIPSGMISILFGLSPIITGVMASLWLNERCMTPFKIIGMVAGLLGLVVIFGSSINLGTNSLYGILGILLGTFLHSGSGVWLKCKRKSKHSL